jgi:hypothetical protein
LMITVNLFDACCKIGKQNVRFREFLIPEADKIEGGLILLLPAACETHFDPLAVSNEAALLS